MEVTVAYGKQNLKLHTSYEDIYKVTLLKMIESNWKKEITDEWELSDVLFHSDKAVLR